MDKNRTELEYNIQLNGINNVVIENKGVGKSDATDCVLNVCNHHNGLHTFGNNLTRFTQAESSTQLSDIVSLDTYFKDIPIHLIKIDTEGAEYDILSGGINVIKKYKPTIVLEYEDINLRQFGRSLEELNSLITDALGYKILQTYAGNVIIGPQD
jgi:FkbM family methyltransferase